MTIDMLRHTSLRELVARALYDSPPPAGTWPVPTAAHGASFAVRNLPHDTDPERAVNLMEATVAAAPELKRRHGVKGWRVRVRKPALVYTLHWQEGPPSDEELLIHETLELLAATELQAVVVRRGDGETSRTAVVINTVHPETGLVKVSGHVYLNEKTNVELSAPLAPGWARATCSGPVKARLLFRQHNSAGVPVPEAGVNAAEVPATLAGDANRGHSAPSQDSLHGHPGKYTLRGYTGPSEQGDDRPVRALRRGGAEPHLGTDQGRTGRGKGQGQTARLPQRRAGQVQARRQGARHPPTPANAETHSVDSTG